MQGSLIYGENLRGVVADVIDCNIVVSDIELHLIYYIHFRTNTVATVVDSDPKAPFFIATTLRCRGGRYSFPTIAPL